MPSDHAAVSGLDEQGLVEVVEALLERLPRNSEGRIAYGFDLRKSHESEWGGPALFEALEEALKRETDDQVDRCPDCNTKGDYEGRILYGGRGVYTCPKCGAKWQNGNEKPDLKAARLTNLGGSA